MILAAPVDTPGTPAYMTSTLDKGVPTPPVFCGFRLRSPG